jgi:mRNA interferase RelE/StbE
MSNPDLQKYTIVFSKSAKKFLDTLDKKNKQRTLKKIRELQSNNKNLDIKKLKSRYTLFRLRVGNFRVVYSIKHERVIIYIIAIGYRKDIYQHSNFA